MKIVLVGGGSGGPVSPLLAIKEQLDKKSEKDTFLFVGGISGPEKLMAEKANISFITIHAGKFRRYFSWENAVSPFLVIFGFIESLKILKNFRPDYVLGSGSYIQVPLIWAAWMLRIPVLIHQQDVVPSLANKLCEFAAKNITVSFESSVKDFSSGFYHHHQNKVLYTGNPAREQNNAITKEDAQKIFNLQPEFPTLFVTGGGTGSEFINNLIAETLPELTVFMQVIHSTGKNKFSEKSTPHYHPYEFIDNMSAAYACADIVVSRAGLSTLTELSQWGKISMIIPMPASHQELNALYVAEHGAGLIASQKSLRPDLFIRVLRKLLFDAGIQQEMKKNMSALMPHDAAKKIASIINGQVL